jgi:hypothetical protein
VPDTLAPVFNTGLTVTEHTGRMVWLSDRVLAITTYAKDLEHWNGRVVAVGVHTRAGTVLVDEGFLQCASVAGRTVAVLKGGQVRMFWGDARSQGAPEPRQLLYAWDCANQRLVDERPAGGSEWNWSVCAPRALEHRGLPGIAFAQEQVRCLQPGDGKLVWGNPGEPGAGLEHNGRRLTQMPVLLMSRDGRTTRSFVSDAAVAKLARGPAAVAGGVDTLAAGGHRGGPGRAEGAGGTCLAGCVTHCADGACRCSAGTGGTG